MFTLQDIDIIAGVLGKPEVSGDTSWIWNLRDKDSGRVLAITISQNVQLGGNVQGVLVSAHTQQGYLELHHVDRYLVIEPDEVMFLSRTAETVSSLVLGNTCTCSAFSNVNSDVLRSAITDLDSAVLLAAMQLSLAESILEGSPGA